MNPIVLDICSRIMQECDDSIQKHGDWSEYSTEQMLAALTDEFIELCDAGMANDIHGRHGMIREAIQLSNCCVKLVKVLEDRYAQ